MNDFNQMRELARAKRDEAIKTARLEYEATLESINELQKRLTKKPSQKGKSKPIVPLRVLIMEAVPADRTFTVPELLKWLERPDTDKTIVRSTLDKMIKRGDIRRMRRGRHHVAALFAVTSYGPKDLGLNELSQIEAAKLVLHELGKPVDLTTLVVEMLERGYEPVKDETTLRRSLRQAMGRNDWFAEAEGIWSVVNQE